MMAMMVDLAEMWGRSGCAERWYVASGRSILVVVVVVVVVGVVIARGGGRIIAYAR